jgi:hypothetical protein
VLFNIYSRFWNDDGDFIDRTGVNGLDLDITTYRKSDLRLQYGIQAAIYAFL